MFEQPPPLSEVDVLKSPDAVAAELASSLPRAEDISALVLLDPEALSDAGPVDLLVGFERHIAQLQAAQQGVLASPDGRALDRSGKKLIDYTREQVGAALRLSPATAERRLSVARTLVDRLPATLDLLRRGQLTYLHAITSASCCPGRGGGLLGELTEELCPSGDVGFPVDRPQICVDSLWRYVKTRGDLLAGQSVHDQP